MLCMIQIFGSWDLFSVFAEQNEEHEDLDEERDRPGEMVGEIEALRGVELRDLEDGIDPRKADSADSEDRDRHRGNRCTDPAQGASRDVHKAAEEIGETHVGHTVHANCNGFRRVGNVGRKQLRRKCIEENTDNSCSDADVSEANTENFTDAGVLLRAEILTDVVERCLMEGVDRYVLKTLNIGGGGISRHENIAEGIDRGLNGHV